MATEKNGMGHVTLGAGAVDARTNNSVGILISRPPCPFAELVCSTAPIAAAAHVSLRESRREALDAHIQTPVRREVNPALRLVRLAGDAVGRADLRAVENLCRSFPEDRFLFSVLRRENQHELCVYARKFNNTMHLGCWWFLNNPSFVEEITSERIELLGTS